MGSMFRWAAGRQTDAESKDPMTTSNTPYAELVKRLRYPLREIDGTSGHFTLDANSICDGMEAAARAIEALEAEVADKTGIVAELRRHAENEGNLYREDEFGAPYFINHRAIRAESDADRRVEEERERCCSIISSLGHENDEDGFAQECIAAIRSRSNGAEPEKDNGVHADACAPAGVEKVTPAYHVGDAVVERFGEIALADGHIFMGALLSFPAGPPDLPLSAVWDCTPLRIILRDAPKAPGSDDRTVIQNESVNQTASPISQEGSIAPEALSEGVDP